MGGYPFVDHFEFSLSLYQRFDDLNKVIGDLAGGTLLVIPPLCPFCSWGSCINPGMRV